jgi:hypothetical protein
VTDEQTRKPRSARGRSAAVSRGAQANAPLERKKRVFEIDLAVSMMDDGPDLREKRRKELALARLMAETIGVILYTAESGSDIRLDAVKDTVRECRHVTRKLRRFESDSIGLTFGLRRRQHPE